MPRWTDLLRTVKQPRFGIKVEILIAPSLRLWPGWTYIHMQILLALFVSQLAREAGFGNLNQFSDIQHIHANRRIAPHGNDVFAIGTDLHIVDRAAVAIQREWIENGFAWFG